MYWMFPNVCLPVHVLAVARFSPQSLTAADPLYEVPERVLSCVRLLRFEPRVTPEMVFEVRPRTPFESVKPVPVRELNTLEPSWKSLNFTPVKVEVAVVEVAKKYCAPIAGASTPEENVVVAV